MVPPSVESEARGLSAAFVAVAVSLKGKNCLVYGIHYKYPRASSKDLPGRLGDKNFAMAEASKCAYNQGWQRPHFRGEHVGRLKARY